MIRRKWREDAGLILLSAAIVIGLQIFSGAYWSDFSTDDDEPAHAVSSLMVRDYLTYALPSNPIAYAQQYYIHYPKVAIGHWPPLFYAGEAGWMLAFGRSRISMIAFEALLAIALLAGVSRWVRRDFGAWPALLSAIALIAPQFMQAEAASVAPNVALSLLAFAAAAAAGRYLDGGSRRNAILFALLAVVAVGVHGRAAAIALLPLALLFTGRFAWTPIRLLMLIAASAIVLLVPWLLRQAWPPSMSGVARMAVHFLYRCGAVMSWPVLVLAAAGGVAICRRHALPRRWLAIPGLALSGWWFHSLVNANWDDHYLATTAPAIAILAGAGFDLCWKGASSRWLQCGLAAIVCGGIAWNALPLARKPDPGYHLLPDLSGTIDLIAADARQEGAFVGEMALRDRGLNRIVLRGSKVLASSDWIGGHYQRRFADSAGVLAFLDQARVERIWIESAVLQPHIAQLQEAVRSRPGTWRETSLAHQPPGILVFERALPLPPGKPAIEIDMTRTLRRTIELTP